MSAIHLTTLVGGKTVLKESSVEAFRSSLRGELLARDDDSYESVRKIWNGQITRQTGLIARCAGTADVIAAVQFARENNLLVSVRGSGNFGVVTSFEFQLHPLGPTVLAGMLVYPMEAGHEVLRFFRDFIDQAPDEVGILGNLRLAPAVPAIPEELHGEPVVSVVVCYAGSVEEGEKAIHDFRHFREPTFDTIGPKPYVAHQQLFDAAALHGWHYYWKSQRLPRLSDEMIDIIVDHCRNVTSGLTTVPIFTMGREVNRVDPAATSYPGRDALHDINISAAWLPDDPDPDRHIAWVRDFWSALEPHTAGIYVNFMSDEAQDRVASVYGAEAYARLVALKNRYDPSNFFRLNMNIKPTV